MASNKNAPRQYRGVRNANRARRLRSEDLRIREAKAEIRRFR